VKANRSPSAADYTKQKLFTVSEHIKPSSWLQNEVTGKTFGKIRSQRAWRTRRHMLPNTPHAAVRYLRKAQTDQPFAHKSSIKQPEIPIRWTGDSNNAAK
jgi:hypothetical protein